MSPEPIPTAGAGKSAGPTPPTGIGGAPAAIVTIHVGQGTIFCTPQGGNVHVYRSRRATAIQWRSDTEFTLAFASFDETGSKEWPFAEPQPAWPVRSFTGTPRGEASPLYYKYTISAGGLFLDPIVIVDK